MTSSIARVCGVAFASLAGFAGFAGFAGTAYAHLDLRYPQGRYGAAVLKYGPCGQTGGARSANVTTLRSGSTIEVRWDEYIDHPGHFRIAFDADGDDDFVDPQCMSGCDSRSPVIAQYSNSAVLLDGIADTAGGPGSAMVTLPDIECSNCTLQVIQVMYDKPPYTLGGNDIYYQCADLILSRSAAPSMTAEGGCTSVTSGEGAEVSAILLILGLLCLRASELSPAGRRPRGPTS